MIRRKNLYIVTLLILSVGMAFTEFNVNSKGHFVSSSTQTIWGFVCLVLTIIWANFDADTNEFEKPFDFGFLVYALWPVVLPWYLIKTRGLDGVLVFFGFIALWIGPWIAGLVAYVYYT